MADVARDWHGRIIAVHGHARGKFSPTYQSWRSMIQRCTNPNAANYYRYGARGTFVCEHWRKFENFLADMGERPTGKFIERIDNSKGYEVGNCKWATMQEQCANRKNVGRPKGKKHG